MIYSAKHYASPLSSTSVVFAPKLWQSDMPRAQVLPKPYIYVHKPKSSWPLDNKADGVMLKDACRMAPGAKARQVKRHSSSPDSGLNKVGRLEATHKAFIWRGSREVDQATDYLN